MRSWFFSKRRLENGEKGDRRAETGGRKNGGRRPENGKKETGGKETGNRNTEAGEPRKF
jgi:hypothetical protein